MIAHCRLAETVQRIFEAEYRWRKPIAVNTRTAGKGRRAFSATGSEINATDLVAEIHDVYRQHPVNAIFKPG